MKWTALPPKEELEVEKRRVLSKREKLALLILHPRCNGCDKKLGELSDIEWDHTIPRGLGGKQTAECFLPLCKSCHKIKTNTIDKPMIAKAERLRKREAGLRRKRKPIPSRPFPKKGKSHLPQNRDPI